MNRPDPPPSNGDHDVLAAEIGELQEYQAMLIASGASADLIGRVSRELQRAIEFAAAMGKRSNFS